MPFQRFLDRVITLKHLELQIIDLPQHEPFRSAIGWRHSRTALFLRWHDQNGAWGVGECSTRPDPFFSHEFLNGAAALLEQQIFPLLERETTYGQLLQKLNRIRGWHFTKAALLEAIHDLWRRSGLDDPLDDIAKISRIPVGISLGLYPDAAALIQKIRVSLDQGYHRIKLKIKPGLDPSYLAETRDAFPDTYISCDANGSFDETNMDELCAMSQLNLGMIEQPFAPDRLDLGARLKQAAPNLAICLDEGVAGYGHLQTALTLGGIDELNLKPGRVGGIPNSLQLMDLCKTHQIPIWIGGMFETGIGRAANLRLAACFPKARAHDLSPSIRYFVEDIVKNPVDMDGRGTIALPTEPVQIDEDHFQKYLKTHKRMEHA